MSEDRPAALRATFSDWRTVKSRKTLQLVFEIPLEQQADALAILGAPMPDRETWVAIAMLKPDAAPVPPVNPTKSRAARDRYLAADEMEQAVARSAMLAKDLKFQYWLVESGRERQGPVGEEEAARYIRWYCDVESRRFIASDEKAYERFLEIETSYKAETP